MPKQRSKMPQIAILVVMEENKLPELPKNRISGIDAVSERLALLAREGEIQVLFLGSAGDGTPLFAAGKKNGSEKNLLILGAGSGDSVLGIGATYQALVQEKFPGWNIWIIPNLDAPRIRENVAQLGQTSPSLEEHLRSRRSPWGPGELPEENLPVHHQSLLQPQVDPRDVQMDDQASIPEDWIPCSPESLALARAVSYLQPELIVSLHETVSGPTTVYCSQPLDQEDHDLLTRQNQYNFHVLDHVESPLEEDKYYLGGVGVWQFARLYNPRALYCRLDIPRFYHSTEHSSQPDKITTRQETVVKNIKGRETTVLLQYMKAQDDEWVEFQSTPVQEDYLVDAQEKNIQPSRGALAVMAILERQSIFKNALREFAQREEYLTGDQWRRGPQILQWIMENEITLSSIRSKTHYHQSATPEDFHEWNVDYPIQTALMLHEALHGLSEQSALDVQISSLQESLLDKIQAILQNPEIQALVHKDPGEGQKEMLLFIDLACKTASGPGPSRMRIAAQIEETDLALKTAIRRARDLKLIGRSKADQQEVLDLAEHLEEELGRLQKEYDQNQDSPGHPEKSSTQQEIIQKNQEGESVKDPAEKDASPTDTPRLHSEESAPLDIPAIPEVPQSSAPLYESDPPADLPPVPPAPKTEPVRIGESVPPPASEPSTQEAPAPAKEEKTEEQIDLESLLPHQLQIPREWGHGALHWENQIPRMGEQPLMRDMMHQLVAENKPVEPSAGSRAELETQTIPGAQLEEPARPGTVGIHKAKSVGFLRERVGADKRYSVSINPRLPLPEASGGDFRHRPVRRISSR